MQRLATCLFYVLSTLVVCCISQVAEAQDSYYLEDQRVLLYKIINWSYDAPTDELQKLCGDAVLCQSEGSVQLHYHDDQKNITIHPPDGFGTLLAIAPEEKKYRAFGDIYPLDVFANTTVLLTHSETPSSSSWSILIENVTGDGTRYLESLKAELVFQIHGKISGWRSGKVALTPSEENFHTCNGLGVEASLFTPILKVLNEKSGQIVMEFHLDWVEKQ